MPTCYSTVRRSESSRSCFLARLAYIRHAASVRPEPGSNSPSELELAGADRSLPGRPRRDAPTSKGVMKPLPSLARHASPLFSFQGSTPARPEAQKTPEVQKRESELHSVSLQRGGLRLGRRRQSELYQTILILSRIFGENLQATWTGPLSFPAPSPVTR